MDPATTPLRDFAISNPDMRALIEANNFLLNPGFITLFQQEQFEGYPLESLNTHISPFLEKCDTIKNEWSL